MKTLQLGSAGPGVQFLQTALKRKGYELDADGVFGSRTKTAVEDFQRSISLRANGTVNEQTHAALEPWYTGSLMHKVCSGDSLLSLSKRYGSSISSIRIANPGIGAEGLTDGTVITVPLDFSVVPTDIELCSGLIDCIVRGLKARYPFINVSSIGKSVIGMPLWCLTFGEGENRVLYNGAHHANEWITSLLLLKFAEQLFTAYSDKGNMFSKLAERIFSRTSLSIIPALNPDGIDLVTKELTDGEYFEYAASAAKNYPQFTFPGGWSANIRGIDLNLQYPAGWENAKENMTARGITSPSPSCYVGDRPLIAPESRALFDYTLSFNPNVTISYHTQGEVIYWKYLDREPVKSKLIGEKFAQVSGYLLEDTPYACGFAGYKDWYISDTNRPGFTVEAGLGENPLPITQFDKIYRDNLGILVSGLLM